MDAETIRAVAFVYAALASASLAVACVVLWRQLRTSALYRRLVNVLFPLSQLILSLYAIWAESAYDLPVGVVFVTATLGLACTAYDVFFFRRLFTAEEEDIAIYKSLLLTRQLKAMMQHGDYLDEQANNARETRARLRRCIEGALEGLQGGDDDATQAALAEAARVNTPPVKSLCDSPVLDALLNAKLNHAHELGVPLEVKVDVPEKSTVPDVELCAVFAKLIDNALNATAPLGEKAFVDVRAMPRAGWLFIGVRNACTADTLPYSSNDISPKTFSKEHGWGRQIVDKLAQRNDGTFKTEVANGVYSAQVTMRVG